MKALKVFSIGLTIVLLVLTLYSWLTPSTSRLAYGGEEHFNESLTAINSVKEFSSYIDSVASRQLIINENNELIDSAKYVVLTDSLMKERFYHGYSHYSLADDYTAYLVGKYIWSDLSALVIPNDILNHPYAACSQQAIVFQELLKLKNYKVRKVVFSSSISGHFCTEVKYNESNHFFDTNLEANWDSITNIPSTKELVSDEALVAQVYAHLPKTTLKVFLENPPIYGEWNAYPAKNMSWIHFMTSIISNIGFLIVGFFALTISRYHKKMPNLSR